MAKWPSKEMVLCNMTSGTVTSGPLAANGAIVDRELDGMQGVSGNGVRVDLPQSKIASKQYCSVRTTVVNALRRIVLAEIPYIATFRDDDRSVSTAGGFVVRCNTGRLHDDMLMDRLALVPIHLTREEVLNFIPGSITVDLCVSNQGKLVQNITSADLRTRLFGKPHPKGKACFPPCSVTGNHVLITHLYPGEKVDITATLEKDVPVTHAAFAVASHVAMDFAIDEDLYTAKMKAIMDDHANSSDKERARAINHLEYIERHRLVRKTPLGDPTTTTLHVKSECGLSGKDIIAFAEEELVRKFTTDNISFDVRQEHDGVSFTIHKQGHTFGSVLQEVCMRDHQILGILSIGYFITHPLENTINVRIALGERGTSSGGGSLDDRFDYSALFARMRVHCARHLAHHLATPWAIEATTLEGGASRTLGSGADLIARRGGGGGGGGGGGSEPGGSGPGAERKEGDRFSGGESSSSDSDKDVTDDAADELSRESSGEIVCGSPRIPNSAGGKMSPRLV